MPEKTINLPIVFHFHQPVDNFEWVFDDVYKKSYKPLIDNIFEFDDIKFAFHFSGNLLEWLLMNKPEFIEKLKIMAKRNQIEIIGGGYYEPIFSIIPYRDKIAQMKKLADLINAISVGSPISSVELLHNAPAINSFLNFSMFLL